MAVPVQHPQSRGERPAPVERSAHGGPELRQVAGGDPGGQALGAAVEVAGGEPEDLAELVVGGDLAVRHVPVEEADPGGRRGGRGEFDDRGLAVRLHRVAGLLQFGQSRGQPGGDPAHMSARALGHAVVRGGPEHPEHPEDLLARPDRDIGGGEVVGQADGELREAPHGVLGVGEQDGAAGAVGDGDRQRTGGGDPPERAEHGQRHTGDRAQHQRAAVAGAQVDGRAVRVGAAEHRPDGGGQQGLPLPRRVPALRPRRFPGSTHRWAARIGTHRPGIPVARRRTGRVRRNTLAHPLLLRRAPGAVKTNPTRPGVPTGPDRATIVPMTPRAPGPGPMPRTPAFGPTTVVNLKGHRDDPAFADVVYVGRAMHRGGWHLTESPLHCPYRPGPGLPREAMLRKYRAHLLARPELLALVPDLRGQRLACWCAPLPCHADVLADLADHGLPGLPGLPD